MDLTAVVMPGAQSLVTAVLTDSWSQLRAGLSRLWARRRNGDPDASATAGVEAAQELEAARAQAISVAGMGPESERIGRMESFWAGYLLGQLAARPELEEAIRVLPTLLAAGTSEPRSAVTVNNTISGTVRGGAVQAGDVSGGISFGR